MYLTKAAVSKRQKSSKVKSSNIRDFATTKNTVQGKIIRKGYSIRGCWRSWTLLNLVQLYMYLVETWKEHFAFLILAPNFSRRL
jgi:hypothetical protein